MTCPVCGKERMTKKRAEEAAKAIHRRDGDRMTAYPCKHGRGWHVGHNSSSKGQRKVRR